MKKFLCAAVCAVAIMFNAHADEGMWLPSILGEKVYKDMVEKGLKLTKEQLYSVNNSSLKDAIIIFGNGCTGEIVSDQGLIFTNHHCGYDAIAKASTMEHNYLRDGFWASDKSKEIPSKGLTVQFLKRVDDITEQVEKATQDKTGMDRTKAMAEIFRKMERTALEFGLNARVVPMYKANQYLLFTYETYTDIRLVGTAPESVGKFGGDTDNWHWPRHTGDFSVFRVYASKNNKPAPYSAENIPMKPNHFLPVSIAGIKEGDYAMILGYPGGTNRYETSYGVKLATDVNNPSLVAIREMRLRYMREEMKKSPATRLQLASRYAGAANYWLFFDGETKQLLKHHVYEKKVDFENNFQKWAKGKSEYENIMSQYAANYNNWRPYAKERVYVREGILGGTTITNFTYALTMLADSISTQGTPSPFYMKRLGFMREGVLKDLNKPSEQNIIGDVVKMFYTDIDKTQHPEGFYEALQNKFGNLNDDETYKKYAADLMENSMVLNNDKWEAFSKNPTLSELQADPAFILVNSFAKNYNNKYRGIYEDFVRKDDSLGRYFVKGAMAMDPKKEYYPDANSTMRLSYGSVKSYDPRDGVHYDYVTTMKGLMEKYVPGDYEFDLPKKLVELYNSKDFGNYMDPAKKDVVVAFITNNDITGGNSGSPVLNGKGELIGLAFDGNYEALSHKMSFDKEMNRTICVDVRYVLWCIEKLGGAKNIIDELKIVK